MKKEDKIKILVVEPNKKPYVSEIENNLKSMQQQVGGLIQIMEVEPMSVIVMNEEGKLNGSEKNRRIPQDIICGTFFIAGDRHLFRKELVLETDFCSISDDAVEVFSNYFDEIPEFKTHEKDAEPRFEVYGFDFDL